jgi:hypothetical protein
MVRNTDTACNIGRSSDSYPFSTRGSSSCPWREPTRRRNYSCSVQIASQSRGIWLRNQHLGNWSKARFQYHGVSRHRRFSLLQMAQTDIWKSRFSLVRRLGRCSSLALSVVSRLEVNSRCGRKRGVRRHHHLQGFEQNFVHRERSHNSRSDSFLHRPTRSENY